MNNMRILIAMEGGVIHSIDCIPPGVTVEVRDYDVEGYDPEVDGDCLRTNEVGDDYLVSEYVADQLESASANRVRMIIDCELLASQIHSVVEHVPHTPERDGLMDLLCDIEMHARQGDVVRLLNQPM